MAPRSRSRGDPERPARPGNPNPDTDGGQHRQRRMGAPFARENVAGAVCDHLLTGATVGENGDDVAHGPRGQEHRRLLAKELTDPVAEPVHGGIIAMLFIADLGAPHGLAHGHCWAGLRVRIEVDADRLRREADKKSKQQA